MEAGDKWTQSTEPEHGRMARTGCANFGQIWRVWVCSSLGFLQAPVPMNQAALSFPLPGYLTLVCEFVSMFRRVNRFFTCLGVMSLCVWRISTGMGLCQGLLSPGVVVWEEGTADSDVTTEVCVGCCSTVCHQACTRQPPWLLSLSCTWGFMSEIIQAPVTLQPSHL